jgi:hypothetical protein
VNLNKDQSLVRLVEERHVESMMDCMESSELT